LVKGPGVPSNRKHLYSILMENPEPGQISFQYSPLFKTPRYFGLITGVPEYYININTVFLDDNPDKADTLMSHFTSNDISNELVKSFNQWKG